MSLKEARTLVVKVGSSLVTNEGRGLDAGAIARWAEQVAALRRLGRSVIIVSSGAIAEGMQRLGWARRPHAMHELQAAAAVGQMGLAQCYESSFRSHGLHSAQVLLTHADLADRQRYLNARSTLRTLLAMGVVPVINENDTVVTDEIKLGDNDTLGALVTNLMEADALVILTDQAGLYEADPRRDPGAKLVAQADASDPRLEALAGGTGSALAKGGMLTKVLAARRAARSGAHTVIASGREPDVLVRLAQGERVGTFLSAATVRWSASHCLRAASGTVFAVSRLPMRSPCARRTSTSGSRPDAITVCAPLRAARRAAWILVSMPPFASALPVPPAIDSSFASRASASRTSCALGLSRGSAS